LRYIQKVNKHIYILSAPVRTGKTTALLLWVQTRANVQGILTPDKDGKRVLYNIGRKEQIPFELEPADTSPAITVGKFNFSEEAFLRANDILQQAATHHPHWLLIDEIGKLEIEQGIGLTPAIRQIIPYYQRANNKGKLLLVIRDTLLDKALERYNLAGATIIAQTQLAEL
jgi:nucleoside-triphosphatase THEP1